MSTHQGPPPQGWVEMVWGHSCRIQTKGSLKAGAHPPETGHLPILGCPRAGWAGMGGGSYFGGAGKMVW